MEIKHKVVAGLVFFAGVAVSLWVLKKAQQKNVPVVSQIANAVAPASTSAPAATTTAS